LNDAKEITIEKNAKDVIGVSNNKSIKLVFTVLQNILVKYQSDILLLPR
jgi:hypothetical protein